MKQFSSLLATALSLLGIILGIIATVATSRAAKRNIIFVLADDHRYDAMGFLGHPWLETPHMDRMAKGGVHFPKAMVTSTADRYLWRLA